MAIISQQENFTLKFKQENPQIPNKGIEVFVCKENDNFIIEFKGDKKNSSVKIDLDSIKEIINYIESKIYLGSTKKTNNTNIHGSTQNNLIFDSGVNGPSSVDSSNISESIGNLKDLINDLNQEEYFENKNYNSQADLIISNGIDIGSLSE